VHREKGNNYSLLTVYVLRASSCLSRGLSYFPHLRETAWKQRHWLRSYLAPNALEGARDSVPVPGIVYSRWPRGKVARQEHGYVAIIDAWPRVNTTSPPVKSTVNMPT